MAEQEVETPNTPVPDLSALIIPLLKGVIYQENDAGLWNALLILQARVRDYVAVLDLDLVLDEAEGYAFLRAHAEPEDDSAPKLPRLVARRQLSFPVSLLLALLRKKLAELDASGGDTRLVLSREEIVELIRVFLPEGSNEAKLIDRVAYADEFREFVNKKNGGHDSRVSVKEYLNRTERGAKSKVAVIMASGMILPGRSGDNPLGGEVMGEW